MTQAEKKELETLRAREEKRKQQAKTWNQNAKNKWETVSCRLPKGTKEKIAELGETTNGIINRLLREEFERKGIKTE